MKTLLVLPPLTELHTPYPATAYLTGFLRSRGLAAHQRDFGIEFALRIFSREGLARVRATLLERFPGGAGITGHPAWFLETWERHATVIGPVIRFLQDKDPSLALRIAGGAFLPEGPLAAEAWANEQLLASQLATDRGRAAGEDPLSFAFGHLGLTDRARYLATRYVRELAEVVRQGVDPAFGTEEYGETPTLSHPSFDWLAERLEGPRTLTDRILEELTREALERHEPGLLCLTIPFPGNLYGALRVAREAKRIRPSLKVALGGGYVNCALRSLEDPRLFDYADFVTLDAGEKPLLCLIEHLRGERPRERLFRAFTRENGRVVYCPGSERDIPHAETGYPTYDGIELGSYLSFQEGLSPFQRVLRSSRWLKLTLAHGCYWRRCAFCDVHLDYVGRYDPAPVDLAIERIEALVAETGLTGFNFVDEAAPPALLRRLSERIIERGLNITWYCMVRLDKAFTPELVTLMARAGCVAVMGGVEVATDRLLKFVEKGTDLGQVARVTHTFSRAGILVHGCLIYGFPTQTEQEVIDSMEYVRQLFEAGCLRSGFWHRFGVTAHSPVARDPLKFGIRLLETAVEGPRFHRYVIPHDCDGQATYHRLGRGLRKSMHHYMHGAGWSRDVREWFPDSQVPKPSVKPGFVRQLISGPPAQRGTRPSTRGTSKTFS